MTTKSKKVWVTIEDKQYDITEWVPRHPGGSTQFEHYNGRDMTDAYRAYHKKNTKADKVLKSYYMNDVIETVNISRHLQDFRNLVDSLETDTDYKHYLVLAVVLTGLMALVVYCLLHSQVVLAAIFLGFFWQQTMFIGHDAGHGAITHSKYDTLIGLLVGNVLNGVSIAWWNATHNVHHCACNSIECDPDIQHMPLLAVSPKYFRSVYSMYHNRRLTFDSLAKRMVSIQHYTFYPIMAIARFNLYLQSILLLITSKNLTRRRKMFEIFTLGLYFTWYSTLLSVIPSMGMKIAFVLISHAVGGIIHVQICLSHFSRNTFDGRPESNRWVDMQLSGTMDIDCPPWMDWFHGGLQFQTEHHLVPKMPRHKLRKLRDEVVRPFCLKHNLPYYSCSFWQANVEVLNCLRKAAKESRMSEVYSHGMNMKG